ncbi:heterokaryon incompatibility protein-domain-containing protein [Aspergillus karnatakaensis]|uniref:heterokaryon incompatibility protein-domain-containing protein n=1 Tax=Aspergillus karnatakaensis TaxID=1810916 RepID=UPI003CCDDD81
MHRWHESGCRRPDVSSASGLPCCAYCFAIPTIEDDDARPQPPQLHDRSRTHLTWPPAVTYSRWKSAKEDQNGQVGDKDALPESSPGKSLLPELPSDDSIRLLRLKPGTADEPIHAELDTVRISQIPLPLYEALSYTSVDNSADSFESCPVYIGNYWDVTFVSKNCGKALRRLRRQKADRLLWVDSLCIDSSSPEEKNFQVHVLREIYSKATKVLTYIGDDSSDLSAAFAFLREITAFDPLSRHDQTYLDGYTRKSLTNLLQRPYFSRLWVLQETLMAREVEMICGDLSARWPKRSLGGIGPDLEVPSWLSRDAKWFPFTGKDLLNVLIDASQYQCADPRDKVFAVLGLMGEKYIKPDYRLPTESVYTGIASYFVKECHTLDFIALIGQKYPTFDLPSWVPDWSQSYPLPSLDAFSCPSDRDDLNDPGDEIMAGAIRVKFESPGDVSHIDRVNSATGSIQLWGSRLCQISGNLTRVRDYTHIQVPATTRGSFIVTVHHQNYDMHESDNLFLLKGYDYPVILRSGKTLDTYTLVTACVLSLACPEPRLLISWYRQQKRQTSNELAVSALTSEDADALHQLYSRLDSSGPTLDTKVVQSRALSYLMVPHAIIRRIEIGLVGEWKRYNTDLGWMFRDQSAVWQFLLEVNQMSTDDRTGEDRMSLRGPDYFNVTQAGGEVSTIYTWDLTRFCWSFLQPTDAAELSSDLHWSPILDHLRSHLSDIREWAKVTEQLFRAYEYTVAVIGEEWDTFPGAKLPQKWTDRYDKFLAVFELVLRQESQPQPRPHLEPDHLWSVSEFESQMRARQDIWALLKNPVNQIVDDGNIRSHALLSYLGLEWSEEHIVEIG